MIRKPRKPTLELATLEATAPRFPITHPNYSNFMRDLGMIKSGYKGEQSVDYYLRNIATSPTSHLYHNLRMYSNLSPFQLDTLLVTPNYLLIMEIKNWGGETLEFIGETHQVKQTFYDGRKEMHDDPILQVKAQRNSLLNWLTINGYPNMTVEYCVIMANKNPEMIFKRFKESDRVIRSTYVDFFVVESDAKHLKNKRTTKEMMSLDEVLLQSHRERQCDVLVKYNLDQNHLISGIICMDCPSPTSLYRAKRSWACPKCGYQTNNKTLLIDALVDYSYIVSPTITHGGFKDFFHIKESRKASTLLSNLDLIGEGKGRGRKYFLEYLRNGG
ncbi:nuclease-related domain-containing protein [Alteribacter keqinensis]|uniref:NERD domain-containing protein n=1 Tax=Alteribacter keqinensis TaxID=2483800 RepID=A0A3M7TR72_9BACI|nr:nuclease-related domain-containing protein [Alteribacter keqinensis]RNA67767.1 NERD domain-containing protein [Alteribacter keqinensis]